MQQIKTFFLLSLVTILWASQAYSKIDSDKEFPGRKLYPAVPVIDVDELHKQLKNVVLVDVRSSYEYKTLRMVGAVNIPLGSSSFLQRMKALRNNNPSKMIVVYCNGRTCKKSYKATQKCRNKKIDNVTAFDAGIFDWAKKYPNKAILLEKTPVDTAKLIPKSVFKKKLISPKKFEAMMLRKDIIVIDVRDSFQREGISLFPGLEERVVLDNTQLLDKFINLAKKNNKTLLVYDSTGKQVRWLMYRIESKKLAKYFFMKGGVNAYFSSMM